MTEARKRGRRPLLGDRARAVLQVRLTDDLLARLRAYARDRGGMSTVVRDLVIRALDRPDN